MILIFLDMYWNRAGHHPLLEISCRPLKAEVASKTFVHNFSEPLIFTYLFNRMQFKNVVKRLDNVVVVVT